MLYILDDGNKKGLPIIFIHGFPFNLKMWEPQLTALNRSYRPIAYDVRGHGESQDDEGPYTIDGHVHDLIAVMEHLKVDKAVVCGLSMGGYIALRALELHPEKFIGAVLCDTRSTPDTDEEKVKRFRSVKDLKDKNVDRFVDGFLKRIFAEETLEKKPDIVDRVRRMMRANPARNMAGMLMMLAARTDTTPILRKITIPTLLIVGEKDVVTPPRLSQEMKEQIPHCELAVLPHAGHLSNLENPEAFNQKLLTFLERF